MCRLLGYLGPPVVLDTLLIKPEHSLIVQSYQPQEMTAGLLNADGFGMGWYHSERDEYPFVYRNTSPIWSDENLTSLSRYIESGCVLASIRSATAGQNVQLSNCQPFRFGSLLGIHNGFIENFQQTLYRPLRDRLSDAAYQAIAGTTDSEHILTLAHHHQQAWPTAPLKNILKRTLDTVAELAAQHQVSASLNIILSQGNSLVASRFAIGTQPPSLYWLRDDPAFAKGVIIASEPIFSSDHWISCPENSIVVIGEDLDIQTYPV